ncbi:MAG TPA: AraC family transcriptional regulator [Myxococcaceae bacterium]
MGKTQASSSARGTVLSVSTRALLLACERLNIPTGGLLEKVGLDAASVADPDARLSASRVSALWTEIYRITSDPDLALHAAESVPFGAYKVFDYVALGSSTVGDGLTQIARYFPLVNDRARFEFDAAEDPISFELFFNGIENPPRPYVEYTFAATVARSRKRWEYDWPLAGVDFAYPPPPSTAEHARIFGCKVRFSAPTNRLLVARETWDAPVRGLEAPLAAVMRELAMDRLKQLPRPETFAGEAMVTIEAALAKGECDIQRVARRLGVTPRTLQRNLAGEGTSFADLVDRVRRAAAQHYLAQPDVSLGEISFVLGFSQPSAFNRAFKRWTRTTPQAYRVSLRAPN